MKKYLFNKYFVVSLIVAVFVFGALVPVVSVKAQIASISQLIELLISIGAIAPNKISDARAVGVSLSQTGIITPVSTSTAYIQVLSPDGGERWNIDSDLSYSIKWGSAGLRHVYVALLSGKNTLCNLTQSPFSSGDGSHTISVYLETARCFDPVKGTSAPLSAGSYKVRVYYTDPLTKVTIKDESKSAFSILPVLIPSVKLTYPNGGESFIRNREYPVKYKLTNVTNSYDDLIYFYLLDNIGNSVFNGRKLMRNGTFDLDIPSNISAGAYKIKVKLTTSVKRVEIEDTSDNFFWISTGL